MNQNILENYWNLIVIVLRYKVKQIVKFLITYYVVFMVGNSKFNKKSYFRHTNSAII